MQVVESNNLSRHLKVWRALAVFVTVGAVACGGASGSDGEAGSAADAAATATPRVFFEIPMNETDHPTELPLALTFGIENFQIGAVPEEESMPRGGVGHYPPGRQRRVSCRPARSSRRLTPGSTSVTDLTAWRYSWRGASTGSACRSVTTSTGPSKGSARRSRSGWKTGSSDAAPRTARLSCFGATLDFHHGELTGPKKASTRACTFSRMFM